MKSSKLSLKDIDDILSKRIEKNGGFLTLRDLPIPQTFSDMEKATKRISTAIHNGEKILIVGDYDVDGVVSTTIIRDFFDEIGVSVESFIPNRFTHGYGLSMNILFALQNADLIITVDNGINANDVATWCKENNKTLIITDHHTVGESLPDAFAIINPKKSNCNFKYDDICGAQVAWYLLAGIKNEMGLEVDLKPYLGLVSIAIIADVMPLIHINRAMVIAGLKVILASNRECFVTLKLHLQKNSFSSTEIAFFVAPLLNSAGRMKDASLAFDFLRSKNIQEANINLAKLIETNTARKNTEELVTNEAVDFIVNLEDNILVAIGDEWHEGVVGIVASRIVRKYGKPAIILCRGENGLLKGSGRSISSCDLYGSVLACCNFLDKFGGHKLAIGMTIKSENIDNFIKCLSENYKEIKDGIETNGVIGELALKEVSNELLETLEKYEPYGEGNTVPIFSSSNLEINNSKIMGANGEHIKYELHQNGTIIEAVEFKHTQALSIDKKHTVSYIVGKNSFRGVESLQLLIRNISR
jgi:single-stranded-DNA-specific exonuclease